MKIRFQCDCGKTLQVSSSAAGKWITCPNCGTAVHVPEAPTAQPLNALPIPESPAPATPSFAPTSFAPQTFASPSLSPAAWAPPRQPSRGFGPLVWIVSSALGVAVVGLCAVGIWSLLGSGGVEDAFVPVADALPPAGQRAQADVAAAPSSNSEAAVAPAPVKPTDTDIADPMLRIAQEFAERASVPDSSGAMRLVDEKLFNKYLRGPKGSAEAIEKHLTAKEVLGHFGRRSFESTPGNAALRHWQVLGKSVYEDQPAVVVRYYSEPQPPRKFINRDEVLETLVPLISFDEFISSAGDLFKEHRKGDFGSVHEPARPDTAGIMPPRAGYMLLLFEQADGEYKLCDLVNLMGQVRLSRSAGKAFLKDYEVFVHGMAKPPEFKVDKVSLSIFGEAPLAVGDLPEPGVYFRPSSYGSSDPSHWAKLFDENRTNRAIRLTEIAAYLNARHAETPTLVAKFRSDFPDDLGADLAVALLTMVPNEPRVDATIAPLLKESTKRIYDVYRDPFMLYIQSLAALAENDVAAAKTRLAEVRGASFETTEMHRFFLDEAIKAKDKSAVLRALDDMSRYWNALDSEIAPATRKLLLERWTVIAEKQANKNKETDGGRRGFGPPGPAGRRDRPSPLDQRPSPHNPGQNSTAGQSPSRRPAAPTPQSATVRIQIVSGKKFDGKALTDGLLKKLDVKKYNMSQQNNNAMIMLNYAGPLETVEQAIDFGKIDSVDRADRFIRVVISE